MKTCGRDSYCRRKKIREVTWGAINTVGIHTVEGLLRACYSKHGVGPEYPRKCEAGNASQSTEDAKDGDGNPQWGWNPVQKRLRERKVKLDD